MVALSNLKTNRIPQVVVISPNDVCNCSFSVWMNRVWDILNEYKGKINITSLTSDCDGATKLGQGGRTVVIDGEVVPVFLLQRRLGELIYQSQGD